MSFSKNQIEKTSFLKALAPLAEDGRKKGKHRSCGMTPTAEPLEVSGRVFCVAIGSTDLASIDAPRCVHRVIREWFHFGLSQYSQVECTANYVLKRFPSHFGRLWELAEFATYCPLVGHSSTLYSRQRVLFFTVFNHFCAI